MLAPALMLSREINSELSPFLMLAPGRWTEATRADDLKVSNIPKG
jgi:hypothetical protein